MPRFGLLAMAGLLLAAPAPICARTWHIAPDGTGDAPTIQAGVDSSAAGDTVEVACGTYYEFGITAPVPLTLRSESGSPDCVTIDGQDSFWIISAPAGIDLTGVTMTNSGQWAALLVYGSPASISNCDFLSNHGGAALRLSESTAEVRQCRFQDNSGSHGGAVGCSTIPGVPTSYVFEDCEFIGNHASATGGAVYCNPDVTASFSRCRFEGNTSPYVGALYAMENCDLQVEHCLFVENSAANHGGAVYSKDGSVITITSSTLVGNTATLGAAFYGHNGSIVADRCIVAGNLVGGAGYCVLGGEMSLSCSDVYGNEGGDWVDCLAGQGDTDGNFSADPLFCDPDASDFTLQPDSPCAPPGTTSCGLVGALPVGCGAVIAAPTVEPMNWARIKGAYR